MRPRALLSCLSLCLLLVAAPAGDVHARMWKPSDVEAAQDYLQIEHGLSPYESVLIMWFAPEFFEESEETRQIRDLLGEYMVIAVVHASISEAGAWSFADPGIVPVELHTEEILSPLPDDQVPQIVSTVVDFVKSLMASGLGRLGEGMQLYVYDGSRFDRCNEGTVWVNYLQERYEFQTPLPGCPD